MTITAITYTGGVDLLDPKPETITRKAIAIGLAHINRWCGCTELPVTDAQHSVVVMQIFRRLNPDLAWAGIYALLHDAHEYLIGDITTTTADRMESRVPGFKLQLEAEKARLDVFIRQAFGIPEPDANILAAVHEADHFAAFVEWVSFVPNGNGSNPFAPPPRGVGNRIKALAWPAAEELFTAALDRELAERAWERLAA
jgi:uncharacterized protein